jgi:hypothetical protein
MSRTISQIARCEAVHTMVRTDQTQRQCTLEHGCPPGRDCPLGSCFANMYAAHRVARGNGGPSHPPCSGKQ